jgi:magnesium transporter
MNIEDMEKALDHAMEGDVKEFLASIEPADAADILAEANVETRVRALAILNPETAADILIEFDENDLEDTIQRMTPENISAALGEMAPDDRADVFRLIDETKRGKILPSLSAADRMELNKLLGYEEDSAGDLMTPELCSIRADATVQEAIRAIASREFDDPISMIFAVDDEGRLKGAISVSELLPKPRGSKIGDVIEEVPIFAGPDEDQESVANNFRKYDLYVMPVVDSDGKLVGRITADDVMDVMQEEAVEDIAHMAGAPDMERNEDSPFRVAALRLPWLLITMCSGIVISVIIQKMIGLTSIEGLAAFVPVIMAMGGNTGMQASAITVRGIALGEIEFGKLARIFAKEMFVGMLMGCVCGVVTGCIIWANLTFFGGLATVPPAKLGFVVAISMCSAMTFAALSGTLLPIVLHKMKIDPALASGPFVTTGNDLSASTIYFLICYLSLTNGGA